MTLPLSHTDRLHFHEGMWYPRPAEVPPGGYRKGIYGSQENAKVAFPFIKERKVALQAGGAVGGWPRFLSQHFERVYTFEPNHLAYCCLALNANRPNVFSFRAALGERAGMIGLHSTEKIGSTRTQGEGPVPVIRIDDMGFDRLDFLCLDVESFELPILKGAWRTLQRCRPTIMLEAGCPTKDGRTDNYADIVNLLKGWEQRARIKADAVLEWTGTKRPLPVLGKPPPKPSQPPYAPTLVDCPTCGGSGFVGPETGYDGVCSDCGGQRQVIKDG